MYKRTKYAKKSYSKKKTYKPYKLAPTVRRVVTSMAEKKHKTMYIENATTLSTLTVGSTWQIYNLLCGWTTASDVSGITLGTGPDERIGDKIQVQNIELILRIIPDVANTNKSGGSTCRVIIFYDKEPHQAKPAVSSVLTVDNIFATQNLAQNRRFTILKDFVHQMVPLTTNTTTTVAAGPLFFQKINIKRKVNVEYVAGGATTTSMNKNTIFMMIVAEAANCCVFNAVQTVSYTDN